LKHTDYNDGFVLGPVCHDRFGGFAAPWRHDRVRRKLVEDRDRAPASRPLRRVLPVSSSLLVGLIVEGVAGALQDGVPVP